MNELFKLLRLALAEPGTKMEIMPKVYAILRELGYPHPRWQCCEHCDLLGRLHRGTFNNTGLVFCSEPWRWLEDLAKGAPPKR